MPIASVTDLSTKERLYNMRSIQDTTLDKLVLFVLESGHWGS